MVLAYPSGLMSQSDNAIPDSINGAETPAHARGSVKTILRREALSAQHCCALAFGRHAPNGIGGSMRLALKA